MTNFTTINEAVREKRTVTFFYCGERRTVQTDLIADGRNGVKYMEGFDEDREDIRRFSVNQIEDLVTL